MNIIIIIIIMWLVQWMLPLPRVNSMPVDFVLNDRQLPDQRRVDHSSKNQTLST